MPLHFVKIQWKLKVTAAPCSKKLEMDDPDCARWLPNKPHKLKIAKLLSLKLEERRSWYLIPTERKAQHLCSHQLTCIRQWGKYIK